MYNTFSVLVCDLLDAQGAGNHISIRGIADSHRGDMQVPESESSFTLKSGSE